MKRKWKIAIALVCLIGALGTVHASEDIIQPVDGTFKPVVSVEEPGPAQIELSFRPTELCEDGSEISITVETKNGLICSGPDEWTVIADKSQLYSIILDIIIPPDDTGGIELRINCCGWLTVAAAYFVTTGDVVEWWAGNPRGKSPRFPGPSYWDKRRARLTPEQLQEELTLQIDLKFLMQVDLDFIEKVVGPIGDVDGDSTFTIRTTVENSWKLAEFGVSYGVIHDKPAPVASTYDISTYRTTLIDSVVHPEQDDRVLPENTRLPMKKPEEPSHRDSLHKARRHTQDSLRQVTKHLADSIRALPPEARIGVCLDLRDSSHYAFAFGLIGELGEPAFPGYYHLDVTKETVDRLRQHGINVILTDVIRHGHEDRPSEGSEPEGAVMPAVEEYSVEATRSSAAPLQILTQKT